MFRLLVVDWELEQFRTHRLDGLSGRLLLLHVEGGAEADVIVFTTAPHATLYLNGTRVSRKDADAYATVEWPAVRLKKGANVIRVVTSVGEETAVWTVK